MERQSEVINVSGGFYGSFRKLADAFDAVVVERIVPGECPSPDWAIGTL